MKTMAQDYYETLGLSKAASQEEIQKAYRKLARKYHPDLNPDDKAAQKKFKDIQLAYDVLNEPEKRKMYDQYGPDFDRVGAAGPFRGGPAGKQGFEDIFGRGAGAGGFQFDGDLGDLFRQFTGGSGGARGRARAQPTKGRDLTVEHTIPFNTAILGGDAAIPVNRAGKPESLQVKIPPGVDTGKKIRLRGQGEPSATGGPQGDLLVSLKVAPHPHFKRSGHNLELRLPVTIGEAALGATVDLPTPGGIVALKVPAGSSSGRRLRVKGQGVRSSTGEAGDLYVELQVKLPDNLPALEAMPLETRRAIEHIEKLYAGKTRDRIAW